MLLQFDTETRTWNARVVQKGDRFGRDDCLTHEKKEPMIEIYVLRDKRKPELDLVKIHGERGYFVTRYNLLEFYTGEWDPRGLMLDAQYELDADMRVKISKWARKVIFG